MVLTLPDKLLPNRPIAALRESLVNFDLSWRVSPRNTSRRLLPVVALATFTSFIVVKVEAPTPNSEAASRPIEAYWYHSSLSSLSLNDGLTTSATVRMLPAKHCTELAAAAV